MLCVDDNDFVADALRRSLSSDRGFEWVGWLHTSQGLADEIERREPDVVVLDADMAGPDVFEATDDLARRFPSAHVVVLSGHLGTELIDRAIDAGAWGILSKVDDTASIISTVRGAAVGIFMLGGEAQRRYGRDPRHVPRPIGDPELPTAPESARRRKGRNEQGGPPW